MPGAVARDLVKEKARLEGEQETRRAVLGRYEKGLATDFEGAERGTRIGQEAVEVVRELGHETLPDKFVEALSSPTPPPEKIRAAIKRLQDSIATWKHATDELKEYLPTGALPGTGQPLEESAVSVLLQYAKDLQTSLNHFATLADPVLTRAKSQPPDAVTLVADLREAELLQKQEALQETENQKWAARFGPAFHGMQTDWNVLRKALTWTLRVREHFAAASPDWQPRGTETRPLAQAGSAGMPPPAFVQMATGGGPPAGARELRNALEQFEHALHAFEHRFEPPAPLADGQRLGTLSLDNLKNRLTELRDRAGELSDWADSHQLGKRFEHLGLAEFWSELQKTHPPKEQLVDVFLKSTLTGWVDRIFQDEPALGGFRRQEHERVLGEFRELDRQLIRNNAQRVALAADEIGRAHV